MTTHALLPLAALLLTSCLGTATRASDRLDLLRLDLAPGESVLTIVGTNDIHGGFETSTRDGERLGGFDWFAGYVAALRRIHRRRFGERGRVLLLDGGDAAQGKLLSNYSEGLLAARLLRALKYDAALAGNHGFDFGPPGWRDDIPAPGRRDQDPLGALRAAVAEAGLPFLGANVLRRADSRHLDWLPPYAIVPGPGGSRVAVLGLESPATSRTTPRENVADLRFTEGVEELVELVNELHSEGRADLFVLIIHEGDGNNPGLGELLAELPRRSDGEPLLDAVVASHTHRLNQATSGDIPYIQSYANGTHFGVIRLVLARDPETGRPRVDRTRTHLAAGIPIVPEAGRFLGEMLRPDAGVRSLIEEARREIAPLADRELAPAPRAFTREGGRIADSEVGNLLTDMMRERASTEIAMINSGDVRAALPAGTLTYEQLFEVLPKNLRIVTMPRVPVGLLLKNIERSVRSCGRRGALQISGLRVDFTRACECPAARKRAEDRKARVERLVTADGRLLYERRGHRVYVDRQPVSVATTDFVLGGGAGYPGFPPSLVEGERIHLRDAIADRMALRDGLDARDFAPGRYVLKGPSRCR